MPPWLLAPSARRHCCLSCCDNVCSFLLLLPYLSNPRTYAFGEMVSPVNSQTQKMQKSLHPCSIVWLIVEVFVLINNLSGLIFQRVRLDLTGAESYIYIYIYWIMQRKYKFIKQTYKFITIRVGSMYLISFSYFKLSSSLINSSL